MDLIHKLSKISKFEYKFEEVESNGKFVSEKREWDGIIGQIVDRVSLFNFKDIVF